MKGNLAQTGKRVLRTAMLPVAFQIPVRLPRYHPNDDDLLAQSWFVVAPAKTAMPLPGDLPVAQQYRQHFHPPDRQGASLPVVPSL